MTRALLGIGSNLGHSAQTIRAALDAFAAHDESRVVAVSRFIETVPVGGPPNQPPYLNAAAIVETSLDLEAFARRMFDIESAQGRVRGERWGPRGIDLDLLLFDQQVSDAPELTLPHPRMSFRRFVLAPAAEIAAEWIHPTSGWTLARLLRHLDAPTSTVAILSPLGSETGATAASLAKALPATMTCRIVPTLQELNVPPKLVVGLQPPAISAGATEKAAAAGREWRATFHAQVVAADVGPSLCLSGDDPTLAVEEIVAAIAAMR